VQRLGHDDGGGTGPAPAVAAAAIGRQLEPETGVAGNRLEPRVTGFFGRPAPLAQGERSADDLPQLAEQRGVTL
jgi:hypothetical protein